MNARPPKKVFFELTRACNLACTHCLNDSGAPMRDELSTDEVLHTVRGLASLGLEEIRFTGGEPTIHPALASAIATATALGVRTSIGTNGVAMTPVIAHLLAEAGLGKAIVSLDGDEVSHDQIRGVGSFRRTWRGIAALRGARIDIRINAVAMRSTQGDLLPLAKRCEAEGVRLFIRRFIPSGRGRGSVDEFLSAGEYDTIRSALQPWIDLRIVDGHYLGVNHGACSAGVTGFGILPNGAVKSCGFLAELGEEAYGNVRRDPLSVIWQRLQESRFLAQTTSVLTQFNADYPHLPRTNCVAVALGAADRLVPLRRRPS